MDFSRFGRKDCDSHFFYLALVGAICNEDDCKCDDDGLPAASKTVSRHDFGNSSGDPSSVTSPSCHGEITLSDRDRELRRDDTSAFVRP